MAGGWDGCVSGGLQAHDRRRLCVSSCCLGKWRRDGYVCGGEENDMFVVDVMDVLIDVNK